MCENSWGFTWPNTQDSNMALMWFWKLHIVWLWRITAQKYSPCLGLSLCKMLADQPWSTLFVLEPCGNVITVEVCQHIAIDSSCSSLRWQCSICWNMLKLYCGWVVQLNLPEWGFACDCHSKVFGWEAPYTFHFWKWVGSLVWKLYSRGRERKTDMVDEEEDEK